MGKTIAIPTELKTAVEGLHGNGNIRWQIIEALINDKSMTYTELRKKLGIQNKGKLNYHLTKLLKTYLIERLEDWNNEDVKSYYELSPFGKDIIHGLLTSIKPNPQIQRSEGQRMQNTIIDIDFDDLQFDKVVVRERLNSSIREVLMNFAELHHKKKLSIRESVLEDEPMTIAT